MLFDRGLAVLALFAAVLSSPPSSSRAGERVHPKVAEAAARASALDVMVFVAPDPEPPGLGPNDLHAFHAGAIEEVSEKIRKIERAYRPERSLRKEDEPQEIEALEQRMSEADRTQLEELRRTLDERLDTLRREVARAIARRSGQGRAAVASFIRQHGGTVHRELASGNVVAATIPPALVESLAAHPLVTQIAPDRAGQLDLDVSMPSAGFDSWWNTGAMDGGNFDAGIVDTGIQQNHPAFAAIRFFSGDGANDTDGHGTHVAGIVASGDATFRGGAFGLDAIAFRSFPGSVSGFAGAFDWMMETAEETPEVVNLSGGYGTEDEEDYDSDDRLIDDRIADAAVLVVKSAGNEGWNDTVPTITNPGAAYNPLVVANMDDRGTEDRADDVRTDSSSVGPTLAGRRKPDLAAPGTSITSTNNNWAGNPLSTATSACRTTMNAGRDFVRCTGTSMAAPHVSSAIVLLADGGNVNPLSQKAVLLNTADAWSSSNTRAVADDGPVSGSRWDKSYGWGYLNLARAYLHRGDFFLSAVTPNDFTADPDDYQLYRGTLFAGEKATLVWQKRADAALGDLDLFLYSEANGQLQHYDTGFGNNVLQVAAAADVSAVIKVASASTSFVGANAESFALATEENFQAVSPPSFGSGTTAPAWINPNLTFDAAVRLHNLGGAAAPLPRLTLHGVTGISGVGTTILPTIPGGGTGRHTFRLRSQNLPVGTYYLRISATSSGYGENYTYSKSSGLRLQVEATPPTARCTAPVTKTGGSVSVGFTASDAQSGVANVFLFVRRPGASAFSWSGLASQSASGTFSYLPNGGAGLYQFAIQSVDRAQNWDNPTPSIAECATAYSQ